MAKKYRIEITMVDDEIMQTKPYLRQHEEHLTSLTINEQQLILLLARVADMREEENHG